MKEQSENSNSQFEIELWTPQKAKLIHQYLEVPNWAPWLAASEESLAGRSVVFPEGQLMVWDTVTNLPAASVSTNRINWSGERQRSTFLG